MFGLFGLFELIELFELFGLFESFGSFELFVLFALFGSLGCVCLICVCVSRGCLSCVCLGRLSCLGCVCLSCVLVRVVPRDFVCACVSCFGFAFSRFATDLTVGLSESARCALGRQGARRSRRLLLSTGVICELMLRVRWVELAWVGSSLFGLSCWVVELRVDVMCGCLRSASAPVWSCGAVCGVYCASS